MNEQDVELMLLKLKEDIDGRFSELIKELDKNGTEFSRALKTEIQGMKERAAREMEEVWSYMKSHLVSIEQGQKLLYDPKDGLMIRVLRQADAAVRMATDAAQCTAESSHAAKEATDAADRTSLSAKNASNAANDVRTFSRVSIFVTAATFIGILVTMVGGYFAFAHKTSTDINNQKAMLTALNTKIKQDTLNQAETVEFLKMLYERLGEKKEGR